MICFEAQAGLCNRILGIGSAYQFAKETGQELTVLWMNNHECNCPVFKIFCIPEDIQIINIPYINCFRVRNWYNRYERWKYKKKYRTWIINDDVYQNIDTLKELAMKEDCYITSATHWYPGKVDLSIFQPSSECRERIETIVREFVENTVGVHIRRTDNTTSIRESPLSFFINEMKKELEEEPETKFYLATDSAEEREKLCEIFQDKIIYNLGNKLERDTEEGVKDAVVDLYLLSKTKKIIGSRGSSFSYVAANLSDISLYR